MLQRLKRIYLKNFKCFREHIIHFDETTIMVGQNNAGKTTVVESLRIIGLATARFRSATGFYNRPQWLEAYLPLATKGIKIYAKAIDTDLEQVFYQYSDPPAIIEATFTDNITISVYINSSTELFAVFFHNNVPLYTKKRIQDVGVPDVRVLPQIVPLSKDEQLVARETLQSNKFSKRTSRNFRNNLLLAQNDGNYEKLNQLISETWSRIQIGEIGRNNNTVYLHLRDGDYVTEIYNMGHGIQMWIQMLWFVVESNKNAIIVLDEPDVYLHADLQRKLIRLLQGNFAQVIIATHSIEIMSEVLPENVLIIDRRSAESVIVDDREKKERHRRQSSTVIKEVEQEIDSFWDDHQRRIDLLSGKDIIRDLSAWSKEVYNVCFSTKQIAGCMNSDEIPMEIQELLSQFHSS